MINRLVLGTVQLGMPYGINNPLGQPSLEEACAIVGEAWRAGISEFDTAQAYGTSEEVLGQIFDKLKISAQVKVISKIDPCLNIKDRNALDAGLERSLRRLRQQKLAALMLHHESQMDDWEKDLGDWLIRQKSEGKFTAIGVSVYTPSKAFEALENSVVDFVQVPANIIDRRFENEGIFRRAQELGKKIYIRSIFLQGLLLMEPHRLAGSMMFARSAVENVHALAARAKISSVELCFGYVMAKWPMASIVFGADTSEQVHENVCLAYTCLDARVFQEADKALGCDDEQILCPGRWPKKCA